MNNNVPGSLCKVRWHDERMLITVHKSRTQHTPAVECNSTRNSLKGSSIKVVIHEFSPAGMNRLQSGLCVGWLRRDTGILKIVSKNTEL